MIRDIGRIIDANLNRATEGLRVIEDVYRYLRDDADLQQRLKDVRHRISGAVPSSGLPAARDAASDVGFSSKGLLEEKRASLRDVLRSNMKRVQEGLRVLEEVLKLDSPDASKVMKEIRYACYQIERDIEIKARRTLRKGLYLVMTELAQGYESLARMAVSAGIPAIQLRYKGDDSRYFLQCAAAVRKITEGSDTRFIVNDRVDIALLSGADGVHLGQGDIPPRQARRLAGDRLMIGLSTHTLDQVGRAQEEPVDYIGFGPVYLPFSKENHDEVTGVEALREAVRLSRLPVVAIGGITRERLEELAGSSCRNVACIGAVASAQDPGEEMQAIHTRSEEIL
ncbi:MAG TPA: thiamine phosphate synthase [Deltaproteobacteria bacterium]|jgi:thiamine-phosphate pyrophosphorylase|nr:thiamine phosphate synthase [Deltaproteobacteria bacterium]